MNEVGSNDPDETEMLKKVNKRVIIVYFLL